MIPNLIKNLLSIENFAFWVYRPFLPFGGFKVSTLRGPTFPNLYPKLKAPAPLNRQFIVRIFNVFNGHLKGDSERM